MENNTIHVTDLYESCYFYLNGAEITAITCEQVNGKLTCKITFTGSNLASLQYKYYSNECLVNLYSFRRAFQQITSYLNEAKKKYKQQQKISRGVTTPGGGAA